MLEHIKNKTFLTLSHPLSLSLCVSSFSIQKARPDCTFCAGPFCAMLKRASWTWPGWFGRRQSLLRSSTWAITTNTVAPFKEKTWTCQRVNGRWPLFLSQVPPGFVGKIVPRDSFQPQLSAIVFLETYSPSTVTSDSMSSDRITSHSEMNVSWSAGSEINVSNLKLKDTIARFECAGKQVGLPVGRSDKFQDHTSTWKRCVPVEPGLCAQLVSGIRLWWHHTPCTSHERLGSSPASAGNEWLTC